MSVYTYRPFSSHMKPHSWSDKPGREGATCICICTNSPKCAESLTLYYFTFVPFSFSGLIPKSFLVITCIALVVILGLIYHMSELTTVVVPHQVRLEINNDIALPYHSSLQRNTKAIATAVNGTLGRSTAVNGTLGRSTAVNGTLGRSTAVNGTSTVQASTAVNGTSTVQASTVGNGSVGTSTKPRSGRGYVMAMHFWEQQTAGTANMLQLQCWAARHNLIFVEPLVRDGYIIGTFNETKAAKLLGMSDLYDLDAWQRFAIQSGMAPVVKREEFLHELYQFEKDVILIQLESDGPKGCLFAKLKMQGWEAFQQQNQHLKVVRNECLSHSSRTSATLDNLILGNVSPKDALVIIEMWKGRMGFSCGGGYRTQKVPSVRVLEDAEKYANKYLGGFGNYNTIMARFEIVISNYNGVKYETRREAVRKSADLTLLKWKEVQKRTSISSTFMTFDYGKYGSETYKCWNYTGSGGDLRKFHRIVYNNTWSVEEWEQSFENITGVYDRGYISLLHLIITAHSHCVILAGSSSYQSYMTSMYSKYHTGGARCIEHI